MGPVDGVPGLKRRDRPPTLVIEQQPGLSGIQQRVGQSPVIRTVEQRDLPAEQDISHPSERRDPGMGIVRGEIHRTGLLLLIVRVLLLQMQYTEETIVPIVQRHIAPHRKSLRHLAGCGQRDRNGPGETVCERPSLQHGEIVLLPHKAFERAERAGSDHLQIRDLPEAEMEPFHISQSLHQEFPDPSLRHSMDQLTPMGIYQVLHRLSC